MGETTEPKQVGPLPPAEYFEKTRSTGASKTLVEALALVPSRAEALDLGSGSGRDSLFLLEQGFKHVVALDSESAAARVLEFVPEDKKSKIEFVQQRFDEFEFGQERFDVINAQYSLAFNPRDTLVDVFERLKASLKSGGVFVGNLFGDHDEWNTPNDTRTYLSRKEVETLLEGLEVVSLTEIDDPHGTTAAGGQKHWHKFDVVAQKPR